MGFAEIDQARIKAGSSGLMAELLLAEGGTDVLEAISEAATGTNRLSEVAIKTGDTVARPVVYAVPCDQCGGSRTLSEHGCGGDDSKCGLMCPVPAPCPCMTGVVYVFAPCPTCDGERTIPTSDWGAPNMPEGRAMCPEQCDGTIRKRLTDG